MNQLVMTISQWNAIAIAHSKSVNELLKKACEIHDQGIKPAFFNSSLTDLECAMAMAFH
jgi:hypothetical protein